MPRNLEIANTQTGLQIVEDPFSVRATDISPINKDEIKVINSMKDNIALLSQSCKDGQLSTNNPASQMTGNVRDQHINNLDASVPNPLMPEEFDEVTGRIDNKLRSLQDKIQQLTVQFDLEKDGEEYCEYIQKQDFA